MADVEDWRATILTRLWSGEEPEFPPLLAELGEGLAEAARLEVPLSGGADSAARVTGLLLAHGFAVVERTDRRLVAGKIPATLRLFRRAGSRPAGGAGAAPLYYAPYARLGNTAPTATLRGWRDLLAQPARPPAAANTACLLIYGIDAGGAERQICLLAAALHDRGWRVRILTVYPPESRAAHYLDILGTRPIAISALPHPRSAANDIARWAQERAPPHLLGIFRNLPPQLVHTTLATWRDLEADRPEVVVGFLDSGNLRGALAGLLAGVCRIVLCGRSVHPGNFPANYHDVSEVMGSIYRLVLRNPRVAMVCNSLAGAASYEGWLGLAPGRIGLLPNTVVPVVDPDRQDARRQFGLAAGAKVVAGVFRLSPEKRPVLFLEVIARLARHHPDLTALVVGDGVLRGEVERAVSRLDLGNHVRLLGASGKVGAVMAASDLLLHVSRMEGMSNVLLEAQMLGCPVVATTGGGTAEAVAPPLHAGLCFTSDPDAIAQACLRILDDLAEFRRLAAKAGAMIAATFTPDRSSRALLEILRTSTEVL